VRASVTASSVLEATSPAANSTVWALLRRNGWSCSPPTCTIRRRSRHAQRHPWDPRAAPAARAAAAGRHWRADGPRATEATRAAAALAGLRVAAFLDKPTTPRQHLRPHSGLWTLDPQAHGRSAADVAPSRPHRRAGPRDRRAWTPPPRRPPTCAPHSRCAALAGLRLGVPTAPGNRPRARRACGVIPRPGPGPRGTLVGWPRRRVIFDPRRARRGVGVPPAVRRRRSRAHAGGGRAAPRPRGRGGVATGDYIDYQRHGLRYASAWRETSAACARGGC